MIYDEFASKTDKEFVYVDWDITSKCNFKCYYCNPQSHDGKVGFPNLDMAKQFVNKVKEDYKGVKEFAIYNIFGGEPTIWQDLPEFSRHIKEVDSRNVLQLLTNGTKSLAWWKRNAPYIDNIIVSVHVAQTDIVELVDKFNELANDICIDFQLAMDIEIFDKCVEYFNYAKEHLHKDISLRPKPLRTMLGEPELMAYSDQQKEILKSLKPNHGRKIERIAIPMVKKHNGEVVDADVDITELVVNKENNWNGWACWIGIDTINVTRERNVKIGSQCNEELIIGNLYDLSFKFPLKPVVCEYQTCGCYADILTRKVKNYKGETL